MLFAAGVVFLFVLAAIVVDLGLARETRREAQNAADASALAAANRLYLSSATPDLVAATQAAMDYAAANFGVSASAWNTGSCSDPDHLAVLAIGTQCISFDSASSPMTVRVKIPSTTINTGLGKLADVDDISVRAIAEAGAATATNYNCSLCFLGPIDMRNSDFTVEGGGIQVNGDVDAGPNAYWTATTNGVSGDVSGGNFTPDVTDSPSFTDPLAGLALPGITGLPNRGNVNNCSGTINPGAYGTLSINNNGTCTLNPGLYVITGEWDLKNNSLLRNISGGVTLYFVCGSSASPAACAANQASGTGGWIDGKNGTVNLTSGATGFADYAMIYHRNNPNDIGLQGNGGTSISGAVYAPKAKLDFNGNSQFGFNGGPVVVLGVLFANGNGSGITVTNAKDLTAVSVPGAIALSK